MKYQRVFISLGLLSIFLGSNNKNESYTETQQTNNKKNSSECKLYSNNQDLFCPIEVLKTIIIPL